MDMFTSNALGQFSSLLSRYQQSSSAANTKHESAAAQSTRSSKAPPIWHKSVEADRVSQKTTEVLWCTSLSDVKTSKTRKALHSGAVQEHPLIVYGVIVIFFLNYYMPSAKHHMPSEKTASRKISCDTTELIKKPEIHTSN